MYPWQPPASFFPYLDTLKNDASNPSTPVASTSTAAESASGRVVREKKEARRKLPEQASNVLKDYLNNITSEPTPAQRRELLALINTIPGAEWYTLANMSGWFLSRRQAAKKRDENPMCDEQRADKKRRYTSKKHDSENKTMTSANILWPTLDTARITKLMVLYRENPNPNEAALEVWSRALKAEKDDVHNWVQMNSLGGSSNVALKSLPTPDSTGSPEPVKQEPRSKTSLYSPTETFAMLPSSPIERKPTLPIANPTPIPSYVVPPRISDRAASTDSPNDARRPQTLPPLSIPQTARNTMPPPLSITSSGSSAQTGTDSHSALLSPLCSLQSSRHHLPITQLPTPVEPPSRPAVVLPPMTPESAVHPPPNNSPRFIHYQPPVQVLEDLAPLPRPEPTPPPEEKSQMLKASIADHDADLGSECPMGISASSTAEDVGSHPPTARESPFPEPLVSTVSTQESPSSPISLVGHLVVPCAPNANETLVDDDVDTDRRTTLLSSPEMVVQHSPILPKSTEIHANSVPSVECLPSNERPSVPPAQPLDVAPSLPPAANSTLHEHSNSSAVSMELDSSSPVMSSSSPHPHPTQTVITESQHTPTPPLIHSASSESEYPNDVPMDLESSPSTPEVELRHELVSTAEIKPPHNLLADLAAFVYERVSQTGSGSDTVLSRPSMQDFNEALRASEDFFERIKSGAYSSQGLVLPDAES
ncbi:hypothetical protein BDY19DRAFT_993490 [Irpex rosettiformis]|uniref:Uncharacterized protein n=1 Tax=Irpex rosettiformis TaxID=378272 RepID=A0ACB8U5N4_9APHY|nr:hypothetical protein BDY19DRAFT_993490 [Irpex rosettiformis]